MSAPRRARIHYRRLPDDERIFEQVIVHEQDDVIVTLTGPLVIHKGPPAGAGPMLETGSRVVWFTFHDRWHDVGRFHAPDGTFRGYYGNILTPPEVSRSEGVTTWRTTDLFLDVWWPVAGAAMLLDADEMEEALARGHIGAELAKRAREEANHLLALAAAGSWPPAVVKEWTLERCVAAAEAAGRA